MNKKYKLKTGSPKIEGAHPRVGVLISILAMLEKQERALLEPVHEQIEIIKQEKKEIKEKIKKLIVKQENKDSFQIGDYRIIPMQPRISWNKALLLQLAKDDPRIKKAMQKGKEWVQIRKK
jgi:hypothetical protein